MLGWIWLYLGVDLGLFWTESGLILTQGNEEGWPPAPFADVFKVEHFILKPTVSY